MKKNIFNLAVIILVIFSLNSCGSTKIPAVKTVELTGTPSFKLGETFLNNNNVTDNMLLRAIYTISSDIRILKKEISAKEKIQKKLIVNQAGEFELQTKRTIKNGKIINEGYKGEIKKGDPLRFISRVQISNQNNYQSAVFREYVFEHPNGTRLYLKSLNSDSYNNYSFNTTVNQKILYVYKLSMQISSLQFLHP